MFSTTRLVWQSLKHHSRIHAAVVLGVAAATAVLTGALIVGDSVRQSLRDLALEQLGAIDQILVAERFFRAELADELEASADFQELYESVTPVVVFPTGILKSQSESSSRAGQVLVVGCDAEFFQLNRPAPLDVPTPEYDQIILNQPLAEDLGVEVGDEVILRLPKGTDVPADSAMAQKTGRSQSIAGLKVIAIVPARGLGRFSLRPNQTEPRNAFVSLEQLQDALDESDRVNAMLVSGAKGPTGPSHNEELNDKLAEALRPALDDFGISITAARVGWSEGAAEDAEANWTVDYWSISSSRMVFDDITEKAIGDSLAPLDGQAVSTYMVNAIRLDGSDAVPIPYSTVTAIDASDGFPLTDVDGKEIGQMSTEEIVLNQWSAEQLGAKPGDKIALTYFSPETTHGEPEEWTKVFALKGIVPIVTPPGMFKGGVPPRYDKPPTRYNDPFLTPTVEGITDEDSIDDWDPPFPYDQTLVKDRDDDYWDEHRTTPKAFVTLAAGRKYWDSRFGFVTSFRAPRSLPEADLRDRLETALRNAGNPGFVFTPVRQQAEKASGGTTPFDGLFLALSFFIIAAALILVSLLFQLGVEQRASEAGTLLSLGMTQRRLRRIWTCEGAVVAAIGALLGIVIGVGYAALMITGLKSWWVDAIATPFLDMHITSRSLLLGYILGVVACVATIALRLRKMKQLSIRRLLAGEANEESGPRHWAKATYRWIGVALILSAIGIGFVSTKLPGGEAQAGGFVSSGAMLLFGLLLMIWNRLRGSRIVQGAHSVGAIASRNASRNPTRSTLVIGLMAVASFLIVAMSAFRLSPSLEGAGGFQLVGESSLAIFADLNDPDSQEDIFSDPDSVRDASFLAFRLKPGDDASCRNLYKSTRPRVLGVTERTMAYYDQARDAPFKWAAAADLPNDGANPWRLLAEDPGPNKRVPVVLDKNTAMYSLHLIRGIGEEFAIEYPNGQSVEFVVVGLLANSVLQGNILIGETAFERLFRDVEGYRYFLAGLPASASQDQVGSLALSLEDSLSDEGLDVRRTENVLRDLLSVQNTYLSTFQSLGLLGLLLGTFGLATVQLRSVLERRRELAMMRAAGFRRSQLATMVLGENVVLLLTGLAVGAVAALTAVLPYGITTGADIPWKTLGATLGGVLATGLITGLASVSATLRAPLVAALRGE